MNIKRVALTTNYNGAVLNRANNVYDPTDLVVTVSSAATCGSGKQICVFDQDYGNNNLYGWVACRAGSSGANPNRTCEHQWVRFNLAYTPPSYQRLACHELAHTVGLRHGTETASCVFPNIAQATTSALTTHDRAHINARY
ncbi:hypothetical protein GCM10009584_20740 [Ornithinimicrobium humiphilum]|uniref:Matrixin n=1 Tax=Ornithinimicrobium humiphilum TaxID=125288 RepID=A0A543KNH5_9MICO|nr:matrixin family metalloprotease [Ornithinimicrobium humiphilum]TQM96629.1 matrixin [Ornithinimicrobium humiphilum]